MPEESCRVGRAGNLEVGTGMCPKDLSLFLPPSLFTSPSRPPFSPSLSLPTFASFYSVDEHHQDTSQAGPALYCLLKLNPTGSGGMTQINCESATRN